MRAFDGLYVRNFYYMRKAGKVPGHGFIPLNSLHFDEDNEIIIAVMLLVSKYPTWQELEHRRVVPLPEGLGKLPKRLKAGLISWLILKGENTPSSVMIHTKDITQEEIASLAAWRLGTMAVEKIASRPLASFIAGEFNKGRERVLEAREQAKESTLANSESVTDYLA